MRAYTTLRTAFLMAAVATSVSLASEARADVSSGGSAPAGNNSSGTASLKYEFSQGLDTSFDTGWLGPNTVQARAVVKIDPVKDGGPLYKIEMPKGALIDASWAGDKRITLKAQTGSQTDGLVTVRHTLTPSVEVKLDVFGLKAQFAFDATKLVNKIPGSKFAYDSKQVQQFAPWGFSAVDTKLNAPDLANAVLFSMPFSSFPDIVANNAEGTFGVRASTKPTFSYKTTKIMLTGADAPIANGAGEVSVPAIDGDFMEVMANVEGTMTVQGEMAIQPAVSLTKAFGYNFVTTIAVDAVKKAYQTKPQTVAFQSTLVHIPLPNVHVPSAGIDLGAVKAGGTAKKTVTIENTGEMPATMTFKSSDPSISVPPSVVTIESKGKYELQITASANNAGPAAADITVLSNDPDSPEQKFKVGMNGADVGGDSEDSDSALPKGGAEADSGCGCKTAGSTTSTGGYLGIGVMALGMAVLVRRRRKA
ncbi:MAG: MYXO-CTERM sorting domain-containing protein [Deltaproteobacteria bacterium]|nr:MYXO-CTERM sorting domain-containing protein [Deltaproteobacteria bacterium]